MAENLADMAEKASLLTISTELRYRMYDYLLNADDQNLRVDVTMATPRKGGRRLRFQNLYPRAIGILQPLLDMPEFRDEMEQYVAKKMTFHSKHTNGLLELEVVFSTENCAMIRKFEVRAEWMFKTRDQGLWPRYLNFFSDVLPNLTSLTMYTDWPRGIGPFPENESRDPAGTMTRFDQDFRAVVRFLSWLIIRHDNFKEEALLVLPADSGGRFRDDLYAEQCQHLVLKSTKQYKHRFESVTKTFIGPLQEFETEHDRWSQTVYDEVLNTKLIDV